LYLVFECKFLVPGCCHHRCLPICTFF
jgi:hypothetical protein